MEGFLPRPVVAYVILRVAASRIVVEGVSAPQQESVAPHELELIHNVCRFFRVRESFARACAGAQSPRRRGWSHPERILWASEAQSSARNARSRHLSRRGFSRISRISLPRVIRQLSSPWEQIFMLVLGNSAFDWQGAVVGRKKVDRRLLVNSEWKFMPQQQARRIAINCVSTRPGP